MSSVSEFTEETFYREIADFVGQELHSVSAKTQCRTLTAYIKNISQDSKITMVCEDEYVDRDYIEDYASFHSRSFYPYGRLCKRFHFFDAVFNEDDLHNFFASQSENEFKKHASNENYLGFVVIRPLPKTFVGRVCLRLIDDAKDNQISCAIKYSVSLFGIKLTVEPALAFQEQDTIVAACATSALWSVFHASKNHIARNLPSPSIITKSAKALINSEERTFPNRGLNSQMIGQAIKEFGLEPYFLGFEECLDPVGELKRSVYGYTKSSLGPAILGLAIEAQVEQKEGEKSVKYEQIGSHAVAVVGAKLSSCSLPKNEIEHTSNFHSDNLTSLIIHDDNLGPYREIKLSDQKPNEDILFDYVNGDNIHPAYKNKTRHKLLMDTVRYRPKFLLHAVYHKIRINCGAVTSLLSGFDAAILEYNKQARKTNESMSLFPAKKALHNNLTIVWDLYLTTTSDLKKKLIKRFRNLPPLKEKPKEILFESWPKYIWTATARIDDNVVFEFLFDATDINQGRIFLRPILYDEVCRKHLIVLYSWLERNPTIRKKHLGMSAIFDGLFEYTESNDRKSRSLNTLYGSASMPSYVKDVEQNSEEYKTIKPLKITAKSYHGIEPATYNKFESVFSHEIECVLWAIDRDGTLVVGQEESVEINGEKQPLGHASLMAGRASRIAGEIRYDAKVSTWNVDTRSGRYVGSKPSPSQTHIDNAVKRIAAVIKIVDPTAKTKFIPYAKS